MDNMEDFVEWPGRGKANRLQPRGMSDYARIATKQYVLESGHKLNYKLGKWSAHYKDIHTKEFSEFIDAIDEFEKINKSKNVP